jgi:hypothetical protein
VTSLITQHNVSDLEALSRGIAGLNISKTTARESFTRLMLKYYGVRERGKLLKEAMTPDELEFRKQAIRINKETDRDKRDQMILAAAKDLQEKFRRTKKVGTKEITVDLSLNNAVKRVIDYSSRNVLQIIEKLPIQHLPEAARDAELNRFGQFAPDLVAHVWSQMSAENLRGRHDFSSLLEAWKKTVEMGRQTTSDDVRLKLDRARGGIQQRLWEIFSRRRSPLLRQLLRSKVGNWDRLIQEQFARESGLLF